MSLNQSRRKQNPEYQTTPEMSIPSGPANASLGRFPSQDKIRAYSLGTGIAATALLLLSNSQPASASPQALPQGSPVMAQANSNNIYVNPNTGNDNTGSGTETTPFKTITRALSQAAANTVIILAPGTYSAQTGEKFPIFLKTGVILQGDPASRGRNTRIIGGGGYLSPTVGSQNITILGAEEAGLTGVTVSNPNPRGYALWVESSSAVIADNTFTGSTHDGISVNGSGSPIIRNNYFRQNGANGVSVFGSATPEVRDNIFENTGYAINIGQTAAPIIIGNRIFRNRSGVVVQGYGRPVLRNNQIEGNTQDGIVALAQAQPNLGTASEPGGNSIRNNGQFDINAQTATQIIPAYGNQIGGNRTSGRLDFSGRVSVATAPVATQANRYPASAARPLPASRPVPDNSYQPVPAQGAIEIPVSAPASRSVPSNAGRSASLPALEPPGAGSQLPSPGVLPVPSANIPLGSGGASLRLPGANGGGNVATSSSAGAANLRYRVIVDATSDREQSRVRLVVPEAFRTFINGRVVMQAGVFDSRANAEELLQTLQSNGFKATMEELQ